MVSCGIFAICLYQWTFPDFVQTPFGDWVKSSDVHQLLLPGQAEYDNKKNTFFMAFLIGVGLIALQFFMKRDSCLRVFLIFVGVAFWLGGMIALLTLGPFK